MSARLWCTIALLTFVAQANTASAQGSTDRGTAQSVESLQLTSAPAFILLGAAPSAVERPATPGAISASLVSAIRGGDGLVPNGYAVEVTPYWLQPRPRLSARELYTNDVGLNLQRTWSLSFATVREDNSKESAGDQPDTRAAVALSISPWVGRENAQLQDLRALRTTVSKAHQDSLDVLEEVNAALENSARDAPQRPNLEARKRTLADFDVRFADSIAVLSGRIRDERRRPAGFQLQLAAGANARFSESAWERGQVSGVAFWGTPSYRLDAIPFEVVGVIRYISNEPTFEWKDLVDTGARLVWERQRFSMSGEYSVRAILEGDVAQTGGDAGTTLRFTDTHRWTLIGNFQIDDHTQLVASFGTDYRRPDAAQRPVISTLGVQFGWGRVRLSDNSN